MSNYPVIVSIGGLDPCGGAGILADIKTIEQHHVLGMTVCTALTFQNDVKFEGLEWVSVSNLLKQVDVLFKQFHVKVIKIGIIENLQVLHTLLQHLKQVHHYSGYIIWDPIIKASAGFQFHHSIKSEELINVISSIHLITPNTLELEALFPELSEQESINTIIQHCDLLLKGGHRTLDSNDILFHQGEIITYSQERLNASKRGTGCVLASAIACQLVLGHDLKSAVQEAKEYVKQYLLSTPLALGFHGK